MPRIYLFTMDRCSGCMELAERLEGRDDVEIVNLDQDPDRGREIAMKMKAQGHPGFEEVPQCVFEDDRGRFSLCDTENIEGVLKRAETGNGQ